MSEAKLAKQVMNELEFLKEKMIQMEMQISEINDDLHVVRPEYVKKLKRIDKGKFIRVRNFAERYGL